LGDDSLHRQGKAKRSCSQQKSWHHLQNAFLHVDPQSAEAFLVCFIMRMIQAWILDEPADFCFKCFRYIESPTIFSLNQPANATQIPEYESLVVESNPA